MADNDTINASTVSTVNLNCASEIEILWRLVITSSGNLTISVDFGLVFLAYWKAYLSTATIELLIIQNPLAVVWE